MRTDTYGEKPYLIVLGLSFFFALLLPGLCNLVVDFFAKRLFFLTDIANVSMGVGLAILIFGSLHFRAAKCLPFAFFALLLNVLVFIMAAASIGFHLIPSYLLIRSVWLNVLPLLLPFLLIFIAKWIAKYFQKEFAAVAVVLLAAEVLKFLLYLFNSFMLYKLNANLEQTPTYSLSATFFGMLPNQLLSMLQRFLIWAITYCVLKMLFERRDLLSKYFAKAKNVLLKAWDATGN